MSLLNTTNAFNATRGVLGLFSPLNKGKTKLDEDEVEHNLVQEFESKMSDDDIHIHSGCTILEIQMDRKVLSAHQRSYSLHYLLQKTKQSHLSNDDRETFRAE